MLLKIGIISYSFRYFSSWGASLLQPVCAIGYMLKEEMKESARVKKRKLSRKSRMDERKEPAVSAQWRTEVLCQRRGMETVAGDGTKQQNEIDF